MQRLGDRATSLVVTAPHKTLPEHRISDCTTCIALFACFASCLSATVSCLLLLLLLLPPAAHRLPSLAPHGRQRLNVISSSIYCKRRSQACSQLHDQIRSFVFSSVAYCLSLLLAQVTRSATSSGNCCASSGAVKRPANWLSESQQPQASGHRG